MADFVKNIENVKYVGKQANEIMSKPFYESDLYSYNITYLPNVKGKQQLVNGEIGDVFQEYSCAFSPSGEVNLKEQWIEPFVMKVNLQECYDQFWGSFLAEQTRLAYAGEVPSTFTDWFTNQLVKKMRREYEDIFFNGDTGYTGSTKEYLALGDGVVKKVEAATGATKITGSVITVENVIGQIKAVAEKASTDVADEDYAIFMNKGQIKVLKTALGNEKIFDNYVWHNFTKDGDKIYAYGFEVIPCEIAKDTILLAPRKNLVLGFDLANDSAEYQMLDMRNVTGDNEFRVIAMTSMAVGVVYPELMVISKPAA